MADEMSPQEFLAFAGTKVSPEVQRQRDAESVPIIQGEKKKPENQSPEIQASLTREASARMASAGMAKEMTPEEFMAKHKPAAAPAATPAPTEAPRGKPTAVSRMDQVKGIGKSLAHSAADLGDMVLSMPGGLAANAVSMGGQLKDQIMESFKEKGKSHRQIGEETLKTNDDLSQRWSTNVLARAVNSVIPEKDGEVHGSDVQKAMEWLNQKIDQGAQFVDKKTGGALTKEEVHLETQLFMNLAGTKGLVKMGGKLVTKDAAPKEATEGHPPEPEAPAKEKIDYKTFKENLEKGKESPKPKVDYKEWKASVDKKAEAASETKQQEKAAERPEKEAKQATRRAKGKQGGEVTFDQVKGIAGLSLGFAAGAYLDEENPIVGGVLGSVFAGGLAMGAVGAGKKVYDAVRSGDPRVRINGITEARQYEQTAGARYVWQNSMDVNELLPNKADRQKVFRAIDEGKVDTLTGKQKEAAVKAQEFFKTVGERASDIEVIKTLRENYVTHFWEEGDKAAIRSILDAHQLGENMSASSRFNEARRFASMAEGKKAGLVPKTEDLSEVMAMYGDAVTTTIANKNMLNRLRGATNEAGELLIRPAGKSPGNYVAINHPTLGRYKVHPDIAPSLRFMFEQQDAHGVMAGLSAVNTALKRNAVSFSLFHAKALADAMLGAMNNPLTVGKVVGQAALPKVFGKSRYLEQLRKGGAGDLPDDAIRDGLKFSLEGRDSVDADVTTGFYKTMKNLQEFADKQLGPVAGMPIKGYIKVNHAFDNFMWARLHTAMKLEVYAAKREALLQNTSKTGTPLTKEQAGKIAAEYANTIFGGLNWQRIAESVNSKFGRDLALSAFSPKGMRALQLLMFAPDWTLSTTRAFVKAFGKGSGINGLVSAKTAADLYRQQLLRSAFWYLTVGDAINYANSGHHIWENGEKVGYFYIDLGDGRKMQISKHFTEPFHWFEKPGQQALNKLGTLPSEAMEQVEGREYLSTGGAPPMKNRLQHALKRAVPIGAGQFDNGAGAGMAGALGFPIYGKTPEQRMAEKKAKRKADYEKRMQQLQQSIQADKQRAQQGGQR